MKAVSLLLLRFSTGSYLIIWGIMKLRAPEATINLSNSFYHGLLSSNIINTSFGLAEIIIGLLVILGLFRKYVYPLQALIYGFGMLAIAQFIIDPFGLYIAPSAKVTWYPSTTLLFSALVMLVFKNEDKKSLDIKLGINEA